MFALAVFCDQNFWNMIVEKNMAPIVEKNKKTLTLPEPELTHW